MERNRCSMVGKSLVKENVCDKFEGELNNL